MSQSTPLGEQRPNEIALFWTRFLEASGRTSDTPQPEAGPFGDSVELADDLIALILEGTKRATAGSVAEYEKEGAPLPKAGDFEIVMDGSMRPRAVIQFTEVSVAPLSSVDDRFAYDEGEGDRTRRYWLDAHHDFFARVLPDLGIDFTSDMETLFQRFEVVYQES